MPIFSSNRTVLPPLETIRILHNIDNSNNPSIICHRQPIGVDRHCSFLVDLHSLKAYDDIKCDDIGSWKDVSSNKFPFVESDGHYTLVKKVERQVTENSSVLKRAYFTLQEDGENDFRRRIDTIICEYISC